MKSELVLKALEKIVNPNVLVNLVSRRVRELNNNSRPLINAPPTMGAADIALTELIEDKLKWEYCEKAPDAPVKRRRRRKAPTP